MQVQLASKDLICESTDVGTKFMDIWLPGAAVAHSYNSRQRIYILTVPRDIGILHCNFASGHHQDIFHKL